MTARGMRKEYVALEDQIAALDSQRREIERDLSNLRYQL